MKKTNGYIIYRGPSELDGEPIVVVATGFAKGSTNTKTGGGLIQTWILRDDIDPMVAANTGADSSICAQCQHRGVIITMPDGTLLNKGRSCYVTLFQAPLNVFRTMHRGNYPVADDLAELFDGLGVRAKLLARQAPKPATRQRATSARLVAVRRQERGAIFPLLPMAHHPRSTPS
jgi:hypothetical protein